MRVYACALAISLFLAAPAEAVPRRVASLNLCTDELLLTLGSPGQILSVTHLAQQTAETLLWEKARRYPKNDGSLISVVGLKPDLVLTMGGGGRDRVRIAERLGLSVLDLPYPSNLADMENAIRKVALALGRPAAARQWLSAIDRLKRSAPRHSKDTVWLGGGGRTMPADGLAADWMRLAGFKQRRVKGDRISLEQLLVSPPSVLLRSDYRRGQYSGEQRWLSHPLARAPASSRTMPTDGRSWTCMGPPMIAEVGRLRARMAR